MTRQYVNSLLELRDRGLFLAGNYSWLGFRQMPHHVEKYFRKSSSGYTFLKRFILLVNAVTSFSAYPLSIVFFIGAISLFISLVMSVYIAFSRLLSSDVVIPGWSSIMVALFFATGLIVFTQGIIGLYVAKIFEEVKHKPPYTIRCVYYHDAPEKIQSDQ